MRPALRRLHSVIHHPGCQLAVGLVLLASAIAELRGRLSPGHGVMEMGMPQGLLALGFYHVLASVAPLVEALSKSDEALEELREQRRGK
ncbi:MAG: hypothetical protein ACRENH_15670 [Gemmatimonadaceae bacterium]